MKVLCGNPDCDSDTFRPYTKPESRLREELAGFFYVFLLAFSFGFPGAFLIVLWPEYWSEIYKDWAYLPMLSGPIMFWAFMEYRNYSRTRFARRRKVVCIKCGQEEWRMY